MYPSPTVSSAEVRPGRIWYLVAALIVLIGLVAGPVFFLVGIYSANERTDGLADNLVADQVFQTGDTVRVDLDDAGKLVWVDASAAGSDPTCEAHPVSGVEPARVIVSATIWNLTNAAGEWRSVYNISTGTAGSYELTCRADGDGTPVALALGDAPTAGDTLGSLGAMAAGVGALNLLPCLGVVAGAVLAMAVALYRNSHRKRLLRERAAAQGYGYGPLR